MLHRRGKRLVTQEVLEARPDGLAEGRDERIVELGKAVQRPDSGLTGRTSQEMFFQGRVALFHKVTGSVLAKLFLVRTIAPLIDISPPRRLLGPKPPARQSARIVLKSLQKAEIILQYVECASVTRFFPLESAFQHAIAAVRPIRCEDV